MGSHEKDLCRRLARRGLATLCLDLYGSDDDPLGAYASTDDRAVLSDLEEAHDFLLSVDVFWAVPQPCGLLGLDVGGRFALIAGATRRWVGAVAVVSTPLTGDEDRQTPVAVLLAHLAVPVLGLYGVRDDLIESETVDEAQRRNDAGQWLLYDGAGHDFLDDGKPGFEPAAAADAHERIIQFFLAALPRPQTEDLG
jgi:carboxymethylenebutenolidase